MGGGSVGISQSLYGTFYGEGGVVGIIILCVIYAFLLNALISRSIRYNSDVRHLIKGAAIASIIPLLRGGDLPGIYAFIGMSFWPVILFTFRYSTFANRFRFLRQSSRQQMQQEAETQTTAEVSYAGN
jgi:hypothetical protein